MGSRRLRRAILGEGPQMPRVPRLPHDGRERVPVPAQHPENARKLPFEDQKPLVFHALIRLDLLVLTTKPAPFPYRFTLHNRVPNGPDQTLPAAEPALNPVP
jgi:hypothetical protein